MPKIIPEDRKKKITARYKELLNDFNGYIKNKENKLDYNEMIDDYLDLPNTAEIYSTAKEMEEMKLEQHRILDRLSSKTPLLDSDDRKWLVCAIKSEDTPFANAYNEKLYKDYQANPNKVKAMLFRKVMTFDPHKLINCQDDDVNLMKFYKENHEVVDLADVLANSKDAPFYQGLNEDFVDAIDQLSEPLNVIAYPKHLAEHATTDDYYATPYMSRKQAKEIVINADSEKKDKFSKYVRDNLESKAGNDITTKPKAYFEAIKEVKPDINENNKFLSTYSVLRIDNNIEPTYADFSDVINDPESNEIFKRQEVTSFHARAINKEYERAFQKNWVKQLNNKNGVAADTTIQQTLAKHKGGFFEKMFNTTSKEYREYEKALAEYNNPNSPNYLNEKNLRNKSNAYLVHKTPKNGKIDLDKLDATSRKRVQLVQNTVQNLDFNDSIEKETDRELERGYPVKGKPFLAAQDVEEIKDNNIIIEDKKVKENNIIIDDINM